MDLYFLYFSLNDISSKGACGFLQKLKNCTQLSKLYLSFSYAVARYSPYVAIETEGAEGLGEGLKGLKILQCLSLILE